MLAIPIGLGSFMIGLALPTLAPSLPYGVAVALALFGVIVAVPAIYLVIRDYGLLPSGGRRMLWIVGIVFGAMIFVYSSFRLLTSQNIVVSQVILSAGEKMRRTFLLHEARLRYLGAHPEANPRVFAGLDNPPADFINEFLKQKGEKWTYEQETPVQAPGDGLYIYCENVIVPIQIKANEKVNVLSIWPAPANNGVAGGLGTMLPAKDTAMTFGYKDLSPVTRCTVTNYSGRTLQDVTIGLDITFQEAVKENENSFKGGRITVRRPWRVDIDRLGTNETGAVSFYVNNTSNQFAYFVFDEIAKAKFMSAEDKLIFKVSTNSPISYFSSPSNI